MTVRARATGPSHLARLARATVSVGVLATALTTVATTVPGAVGAVPAYAAQRSAGADTHAAAPQVRTTAAARPALRSGWTPRPAQYPGTVLERDLAIRMSDGTVLRGDLTRPADASGRAVPGRFPVIVTITAYNKNAQAYAGGIAGAAPAYLVQRGYAQLTVDARGTGSSEGQWGAFSPRENEDSAEVVAWAASSARPWSNGAVGMAGPSYMGINQIFAASQRPKGLKALFPQVPAGDVYRDVVASGGQVDAGFIPLWLGLVTTTGLIPPATLAADTPSGLAAVLDHLMAAGTFTLPLLLNAVLGQDPAYDGRFYRDRSPIEVVDRVDVPTFLVAGEFDLFQRGTPLLFENLRERGVPTRMVVGPWDHLQGSSGAGMEDAGYGTLAELQLRWFDRYVKGRPDAALGSDIAPMTYYEQGSGAWRRTSQYVADDLSARTYQVASPSTVGGRAGTLVDATSGTRAVPASTSVVPPVPVSGLCTRSANQWTAGLPAQLPLPNPCFSDNRVNDLSGVTFDTAPVTRAVHLQGPINARLYVSTPGGDGLLSVAVEDVAPDGTVTRLTGGWQTIAHRASVPSRTRRLDGKVIQPYHPFTRAAKKSLAPGQVGAVDVEVFPTGAVIAPGHRLRLAVQAFDVPHLVPTLPDLPATLAPITIHASRTYPSQVTLPVR